jgi:transcriptional regulator with XRE-family HTH domain
MHSGRVGAKVKRLREAQNMTQAELAKKAKVTRPYITMLESGARTRVASVTLQRIAKALGVPVARLGGGHTVSRLGEDRLAPFMFGKGDRVAPKRWDGEPDKADAGVVVDGICWYTPGGGSFMDLYEIRRDAGDFYQARGPELAKL